MPAIRIADEESVQAPERKPWDRLPEERASAWKYFKAYLDAGPGREKAAVYRAVSGNKHAKRPAGGFSKITKQFRWEERAKAYDEHLEQAAYRQRMATVEQQADKWVTRQLVNRENAALAAGNLIEKAVTQSKAPLFRSVSKDGKTIVEAVDWRDFERAARTAKLATEIAGGVGALELRPTETRLTGPGGGPLQVQAMTIDLTRLSPEELANLVTLARKMRQVETAEDDKCS